MTQVFRLEDATCLALPGRTSFEIVSAAHGGARMTLRRVEIPPSRGDAPARSLHRHLHFDECIHVVSGRGITSSQGKDVEVGPGDTIVVPAAEAHATRNIGDEPLVLLCFFPVGDVRSGTEEASAETGDRSTPDPASR
ncbi:MAG: cupin domain-containing protein [Pseudomonadota bacterium]|nr:cupin domain-containing protein [Pseudomonadota bacterium]